MHPIYIYNSHMYRKPPCSAVHWSESPHSQMAVAAWTVNNCKVAASRQYDLLAITHFWLLFWVSDHHLPAWKDHSSTW